MQNPNPNPYAPPRAEVDDVVAPVEAAPALWNPNAAASWSLFFTPIFGAYLHMKNWQALGEPERAASSKAWVIGCVAFFVVMTVLAAFLPESKGIDGITRAVALGLLLSWYFSSARAQQKYVIGKFGTSYPRKGWAKPMGLAILAFIGFIVVAGLIGGIIGFFSADI